jgi:hypothetical protein
MIMAKSENPIAIVCNTLCVVFINISSKAIHMTMRKDITASLLKALVKLFEWSRRLLLSYATGQGWRLSQKTQGHLMLPRTANHRKRRPIIGMG